MNEEVGLSKCFAHVEFATHKEAEEAKLHMHGGQLDHNIMKVVWAHEHAQEERRREQQRRDADRRAAGPPGRMGTYMYALFVVVCTLVCWCGGIAQ
jgi:hypothetical protein